MRLIGDGVVDREGVGAVARRLAVSERHLQRLLVDEVGAPPLAIARAQRAQTARVLAETTELPFTDVAYAAGFRSVRQFNDTIREVFAASPSQLRQGRRRGTDGASAGDGRLGLRLALRPPYHSETVLAWLAARAIPGVEAVDPECATYRRTLDLPCGPAVAELTLHADHVAARLKLAAVADLGGAVARLRRLLDLDANPHATDAALGTDPALAPLVVARPGLRVPGTVSASETAIRTVLGQQVSVAAARTLAGRLVALAGTPLPEPDGTLTHVFPTRSSSRGGPRGARHAGRPARRPCASSRPRLADGRLDLEPGADRPAAREGLIAVAGVGPWTRTTSPLRALRDPTRSGRRPWGSSAPRAARHRPQPTALATAPSAGGRGARTPPAPVERHVTGVVIDTPIGPLTLQGGDLGLRAVWFGVAPPSAGLEAGEHPVLTGARVQLEEYFAGERRAFDLPLDVSQGTEFQRQAWLALAEIPYGETTTYSEQARRIGRPSAVRAVGAANGRNPLPIVLPCHRVVGASGALTGFGGGLEVKRALLDLEQGVLPLR
jgi:AraC family transcriptional regulator of adaptative response / DNA-3-methyladenine glycosylase II